MRSVSSSAAWRADGWIGARAEAAGDLRSDRQLMRDRGSGERLRVGVEHAELDAAQSVVQHARDGVRSSAADAENANLGARLRVVFHHELQCIECHG